MYVNILMVGAGVDTVLLVGVCPRYILPVVFMHAVRNRSVLVKSMSLYRFLMLLLDLPLLW
jgi:hypothetical protein